MRTYERHDMGELFITAYRRFFFFFILNTFRLGYLPGGSESEHLNGNNIHTTSSRIR